MLATTSAARTSPAAPRAVALADQGQQALAGDDPQPHPELVEDDQRRGRQRQHPEQLVAVLGAEDRVGRDPGRVVVGEAGQQPGPDHRQQRRQRPAPQQQLAPPRDPPVDVATGGAWARWAGGIDSPA